LRRHSKSVGYPIEKCEEGNDVNRFRNLIFCPACSAKVLDIFGSRSISGLGDQLCIAKKCAFRIRELRFIQLALRKCADCLVGSSLDPQEVCVAVNSIRAVIEI
jgi:hypothetical protein